jgi:hypothetical protein
VIFSYKGTFSRTFREKLKKNIFGHQRVKEAFVGTSVLRIALRCVLVGALLHPEELHGCPLLADLLIGSPTHQWEASEKFLSSSCLKSFGCLISKSGMLCTVVI